MGARALRQTIACVVGLLLPAPGAVFAEGVAVTTTPAPTGAFPDELKTAFGNCYIATGGRMGSLDEYDATGYSGCVRNLFFRAGAGYEYMHSRCGITPGANISDWSDSALNCLIQIVKEARNEGIKAVTAEKLGNDTAGAIETASKAKSEAMARYTTTGTFDLNPFCMAGATATGSLDRSNTAISVRGLKCSNGITSYQAFASKLILLGGPDGLFQAASRQVLEDYVLTMSRYYLGSEQNVITGQVTPVKVPVCNLADGEGKLNDANGHLDRSYTVASNWIKDLVGGSKQFKDYWSCGTPCLFKKVDDVYFPARRERLDAVVPNPNSCQLEYAYFRGLWPHVLWRHTREVVNDVLRDGKMALTVDESGKSPCGQLASDLEGLNQTLHNLDHSIALTLPRGVPEVACARGGNVMQDFTADSDFVERIRSGTAEAAAGGVDQATSNAICMLEGARGLQIRVMSRVMSCEAIWRAQVAFSVVVTDPAKMKLAIKRLETLVEAQDDCVDDDAATRRNCYAPIMKQWFCNEFYKPLVAEGSGSCASMDSPAFSDKPLHIRPRNHAFACMFNPKTPGCPGAPAAPAAAEGRSL